MIWEIYQPGPVTITEDMEATTEPHPRVVLY